MVSGDRFVLSAGDVTGWSSIADGILVGDGGVR